MPTTHKLLVNPEPQPTLPPLQEGMLLQGGQTPGHGVYLQQLVIRVSRHLITDILRSAFDILLARHTALRSGFFFTESARAVWQLQAQASMPIQEEDLSHLDPQSQEARLEEFLKGDRAKEFALDEVPLMRVTIFSFGDSNHCLVWTSHHAILDGRSRVILLQELWALESALSAGKSPAWDPPPDYAKYLAWLERQQTCQARTFWQSQLDGMVTASLMPRSISLAPPTWGCRKLHLDEVTTARLRQLTRREGVTINMFLMAAWAVFLSHHNGSEDVLFGATRACRTLEGVATQGLVGLLINTVPIRAKPRRDLLLGDFLRDIQQQWINLRDHENTPLERIHEWGRFDASSPLFHSIVVFERGVLHDLVSSGDTSWNCELYQRTGVPLMLSAFDGKSLQLELHYNGVRYGAEDGAHFLGLLKSLIFSMLEGTARPLRELSLLSPEERQRIVVDWNQTSTSYPAQTRVEELFAIQARLTPQATALSQHDARISYESLDAQAEALCARLLGKGLEPGGRVAVALERSPELIIAMLAILKAGCAYVPIETNAPGSRAQAILGQVRPQLLLIHSAQKIAWIEDASALDHVDLATNHSVAKSLPRGNLAGRVDDAAYIMFTSGSTGVPKGVVVPHRAIIRLVKDTNYFNIVATDVIGHLSNPAFDASTFEVWGALLNGGTVSIIESDIALSPGALEEKIATDRITALWLTTALFNEFAREQPGTFRHLRYLLTGGEKVSPSAFAAVAKACPQLKLLNGYGPTETTTFAATFRYAHDSPMGESIPIGRPIANTTIFILDERGDPVPVGIPGEIHIGGPGVALGYFEDPELTDQHFIPDPFDPGPNRLLYRSGDIGRFLLDGNIEFLGRVDQQLKLRGFRIEPAEIEKALTALDEISACAVVGRFEQGTCVGLSAFVTLTRPPTDREDQQIAAQLKASLPSYMVPDCITILDRLPLNANGKMDRAMMAALSAPAVTAKPSADFQLTETQSVLLAIWRDLLAKDEIGLDDNFFALGGHSIRAIRFLHQIQRRFGISLPPSTLYATPTIRGLASRIAGLPPASAPLVESESIAAADEAVRPATDTEQFIWDYNRQNQHPEILNISRAVRITGALDAGALEASFRQVILRHAPLRTRFPSTSGNVMAELIAAPNFSLPVEDLGYLPPEEKATRGHQSFVENTCRPFVLHRDLLLRARLLKFHEEDFLLLVAVHHIVADGWSLEILRRDLFVTYESLINSVPNPLPPLLLNQGSLAVLQKCRSVAAVSAQLAEWKQRLEAPLPSLDRLFRQPTAAAPDEPSCWAADAKLTSRQTQALQLLAQKHEVTLFVLLLAIYDLLLAQRTGNGDVIVGTALAGRQDLGADDLVGTFIQLVPIRVNLTGCTHFKEVLQRVKHSTNLVHEIDPLPLGKLAALVPGRNPPRSNPIFDTALNHYAEDPTHDFCPTGLKLTVLPNPVANAKLPLGFYSLLKPEGLSLRMCSQSTFFTQEQTEQLLNGFVQLLNQVTTNPDLPLEGALVPCPPGDGRGRLERIEQRGSEAGHQPEQRGGEVLPHSAG
jgi:amino acid adenylation domain-containing protein